MDNDAVDRSIELVIERIEIIYYKAAFPTTPEEVLPPSHKVIVSALVDGGRRTAVREGAHRNRFGRVSESQRAVLQSAAELLMGSTVSAPRRELGDELDRVLAATLDTVYRAKRQRAQGLRRFRAWRKNRRYLQGLTERLDPLLTGVRDLVASDVAPPDQRSGHSGEVVIANGGGWSGSKAELLAKRFIDIDDYVSFPLPTKPVLHGHPINEFEDYEDLRLLRKNGTKGYLYYYYSLGFGLRTRRLSKFSLVATDDHDRSMVFSWSTSQLSSIAAHALCVNKEATRQLLIEAGLPVPRGRAFSGSAKDAVANYAATVGYPVVTKPVNGSKGEGVVVNIRDEAELTRALGALQRSIYRDSDTIVERYLPGRDYRIVVVGDEVRGALLRAPASVCGDGEHSTLELMLAKHAWRMRNPHFIGRSAFIDEESAFGSLGQERLDLTRVPDRDELVTFGTSCNLSQGADSVDVLEELHPTVAEAAVRAVRAVPGLRYCGVDMLLEDHTQPIDNQAAGIIELNAKAAIGNCEYPMFGQSRAVVRHVFLELADEFGLALHPMTEHSRRILCEVRGKLRGKRYLRWLEETAQGLDVRTRMLHQGKRRLDIEVEGLLAPVAMLTTRLIIGPLGARPTSVRVTRIEAIETTLPDDSSQPSPAILSQPMGM